MNISGRNRKSRERELALHPAKGKTSYNLISALLRAALIFMLSFGSVGGFLEAYDMEYNRRLCMLFLFMLSLVLSLIFEIRIRWVTNLAILSAFGVYAYLAVTFFWELNSGAYAVINRMYQVARNYLRLDAGMEYSLRVEDLYGAVTGISLLVGVVLVLIFTIRFQYKTTIGWVVTMTLTLYLIPMYFEKSPGFLCSFFLLSGYVTVFILQACAAREKTQEQIRFAFPLGVLTALAGTMLLTLALPRNQFTRLTGKCEVKASTEKTAAAFAQYGLMAFFQRGGMGTGVSGGMLSRGGMLMSDYETDLIVRYTPYSWEPLYLRAYTGCIYRGDRWALPDYKQEDLAREAETRRTLYENAPDRYGEGHMEVENVGAAKQFNYRPYYTLDRETVIMGNKAFYTYYPPLTGGESSGETPGKEYLTVADACYRAVETVCRDGAFHGTPKEIAAQIENYFQTNYTYTLRVGYLLGSEDYITNFLLKSKKGYCSHFASAAVMLLRYMGIPARFVEGYALSYSDVVLDGKIQQEAYDAYYKGYAPLGETALLEIEVSDDQAHAWVEMFVEGEGWIVFDPTPSAGEEEEVGDFWSNFLGGDRSRGEDRTGAGELPRYLEQGLTGGVVLLAVIISVAGVVALGRRLGKKAERRNLSEEERAREAYRSLTKYLGRKFPEFALLATPKQELEWLDGCRGITLRRDLSQDIYRLFYAPGWQGDFQGLEAELKSLLGQLQKEYGR